MEDIISGIRGEFIPYFITDNLHFLFSKTNVYYLIIFKNKQAK